METARGPSLFSGFCGRWFAYQFTHSSHLFHHLPHAPPPQSTPNIPEPQIANLTLGKRRKVINIEAASVAMADAVATPHLLPLGRARRSNTDVFDHKRLQLQGWNEEGAAFLQDPQE